ncbi:MAG TPA: SCP2 sterol-binding domain-containing protein [Steroidobacteraceae bacterium]|jgi:ubiquinone biosynthesis protein UbiJ|nr:SCP2 sterol-binding domain-containing protein [Steroidobacteraceae bacterium]
MGWIESLIDRTLARASMRAHAESTRARELLADLSGRPLAVLIEGTPWQEQPLILQSNGTALHLLSTDAAAATPAAARLIGAPMSLMSLLSDAEAVIRRGDVRVEGDVQLAQRYRELALLLAPDLEHTLSGVLGRSAAHLIMGAARGAADTARHAADTSVRNVAEFLSHESGDLVSRQEAEHYLRGVEELREQLDRLEARMDRLTQRLGGLTDDSGPA